MTKPTFYYMLESPPCRMVMAVARFLDIELDLKKIDLSKKEQLNPEYVKINPFHVVPTLVDTDGFVVWESRAIASYLIQSRAPESPLYPSDLKKRITVDKFLQYDLGTLYRAISDVVYGLFFNGKLNEEKIPRLEEILKTLDGFFAQHESGPFLAGGDQPSIADYSMSLSLSMLDMVPQLNLTNSYPGIAEWNGKVEEALQAVNVDGKFDEARANMKAYAQMLQEKARSDAH